MILLGETTIELTFFYWTADATVWVQITERMICYYACDLFGASQCVSAIDEQTDR